MSKPAGCLPGTGFPPKIYIYIISISISMQAWRAPRDSTMSLLLPRPKGQLSLPHTAVIHIHYPKQKEALWSSELIFIPWCFGYFP